jgi:hypothetical protein
MIGLDVVATTTTTTTAAGRRTVLLRRRPAVIVSGLVVLLVAVALGIPTAAEGRLVGGTAVPGELLPPPPAVPRGLASSSTADNVFGSRRRRDPLVVAGGGRPANGDNGNNNEPKNNGTSTITASRGGGVVVVRQAGTGDNASCVLNDQGLFGDAGAARDGGAQAYDVSFSYQLHLLPGTTMPVLMGTVLPDVDRAVVTAILAEFFDDCREKDSTRRGRRRRRSRRSKRRFLRDEDRALQQSSSSGSTAGTVEAVSALPLDQLVQPTKCKFLFGALLFEFSVSRYFF